MDFVTGRHTLVRHAAYLFNLPVGFRLNLVQVSLTIVANSGSCHFDFPFGAPGGTPILHN